MTLICMGVWTFVLKGFKYPKCPGQRGSRITVLLGFVYGDLIFTDCTIYPSSEQANPKLIFLMFQKSCTQH